MALILDFPITSLIFIQFTWTLYFTWTFVWKKWTWRRRKWKLLYFSCHMVKGDISRFHNPSPSQICKWISTKMIIFWDNWSFLHPIDSKLINICMKKQSIRCRTDHLSSRIIILRDTHLHICEGEGLGNLCLLTLWYET